MFDSLVLPRSLCPPDKIPHSTPRQLICDPTYSSPDVYMITVGHIGYLVNKLPAHLYIFQIWGKAYINQHILISLLLYVWIDPLLEPSTWKNVSRSTLLRELKLAAKKEKKQRTLKETSQLMIEEPWVWSQKTWVWILPFSPNSENWLVHISKAMSLHP